MLNRELFLALVSLDAYNRGYGENVRGLASSGQIGQARLRKPGDGEQNGWVSSGFYALAYEVPAGYIDGLTGTVISYRGTNFDPGDSVFKFFQSPLWADILSGWSVGAGLPGKQAVLALEFYNAVAPDGVDPRYANITTTGHSLGGGLAGFVANVFNRNAVLFDHMPYTPVSAALRTCLDTRIPVWVRSVRGRQPGFDRLSLSGVRGARLSRSNPLTLSLSKGAASRPDLRRNDFAQRAQRTQRSNLRHSGAGRSPAPIGTPPRGGDLAGRTGSRPAPG